ncbi:MAG TPA: hypothetical protein VJ826_16415 [Candidatus Polarisedimenticolaceae bacterium]|nr:hypothetical protein [Candidatus Polarisedimenticolaceae bacterium]
MTIPLGILPGLKLRAVSPSPSPAAALARAAALSATVGDRTARATRRVLDQGSVSCCVSCALAVALETLHADWPLLAPLFHYHVARVQRGYADRDGSIRIEDGRDVLASTGICRESLHSYPIREEHVHTVPSPEAFRDALQHRLLRAGYRLRMGEVIGTSKAVQIRARLIDGDAIVLGFRRPSRFPGGVLDARFLWDDPAVDLSSALGHCVLVTGFSDMRGALRIQDSEGAGAYDGGGWWMGYRVVDTPVAEKAYWLRA